MRRVLTAAALASALAISADAQSQPVADERKTLLKANVTCLAQQSAYAQTRQLLIEGAEGLPDTNTAKTDLLSITPAATEPAGHLRAILILSRSGVDLSENEYTLALANGDKTFDGILDLNPGQHQLDTLLDRLAPGAIGDRDCVASLEAATSTALISSLTPTEPVLLTSADLGITRAGTDAAFVVTLDVLKGFFAALPSDQETRAQFVRMLVGLFASESSELADGTRLIIEDDKTRLATGLMSGPFNLSLLWQRSTYLAELFVEIEDMPVVGRDFVTGFVAQQMLKRWQNSRITNGYGPLREEIARVEAFAADMDDPVQANAYRRLAFEGVRMVDEHVGDRVPDMLYTALRGPIEAEAP